MLLKDLNDAELFTLFPYSENIIVIVLWFPFPLHFSHLMRADQGFELNNPCFIKDMISIFQSKVSEIYSQTKTFPEDPKQVQKCIVKYFSLPLNA